MKASEIKVGNVIQARRGCTIRRIESVGDEESMISPLHTKRAYAIRNEDLCRHWEVVMECPATTSK